MDRQPLGAAVAGLLSWLVFGLGCIAVTVAMAVLYGISAAPRGAYQDTFIISLVTGVLYFLVLKLSRCRHDAVVAAPIAMVLLAFLGGHWVAYGEAQDFAWDYVHTLAPEKFDGPQWQDLDRQENFRRFVGHVTGTPGSGVWAYLRLQSSIGTEESHVGKGASGRMEWTVSGLFVWLAWLVQPLILLLGVGAAAGAVAPEHGQRA